MIQRIQSLYLLGIVIVGLILFFIPVADFAGGLIVFKLSGIQLQRLLPGMELPSVVIPVIVNILMMIIAMATIFLYKKRDLQVKICRFMFLINAVFIVFVFFTAGEIETTLGNIKASYSVGAYLPLLTFGFLILSIRAINKDEALIKSADRLR